MASSSYQIPDSDLVSMAVDTDDLTLSRSNSLPNGEDAVASSNLRSTQPHKRDKGKGRERDPVVRIKEEPSVVTLSMSDPALLVSLPHFLFCQRELKIATCRRTKTTVLHAGPWDPSCIVTGVQGPSTCGVLTPPWMHLSCHRETQDGSVQHAPFNEYETLYIPHSDILIATSRSHHQSLLHLSNSWHPLSNIYKRPFQRSTSYRMTLELISRMVR